MVRRVNQQPYLQICELLARVVRSKNKLASMVSKDLCGQEVWFGQILDDRDGVGALCPYEQAPHHDFAAGGPEVQANDEVRPAGAPGAGKLETGWVVCFNSLGRSNLIANSRERLPRRLRARRRGGPVSRFRQVRAR